MEADHATVSARETITRRQFLTWLSIALGALGAAIVGIPIVGFVLAPLVQKAPQLWRVVGAVDEFQVGETVQVTFLDPSPLPWAGVTARTAAWLRRENAEMVRQAIAQLTDDQQQVIILKFLEGYCTEEIAQLMDKDPGAVRALQHRALVALQKIVRR